MRTKLGVLTTVVALAAVLGFAGTTSAGDTPGHDECELGGGNEAGDIDNLSASYDAANDLIIVEILLCDTKANNIKYRVHFDHTAPFFDDPPEFCATTSDDTMKRFKGNKDTGPGAIVMATTNVANDTLIYTVAVDDLDPELMLDDTVFIWADTQRKGIIDRAPDTDDTDSCAKPEVEAEVLALTLTAEKIVFVTSGRFTGNLVQEATNLGLTPSDGLDAGDKICQKLADDAPLAGTYKAWLSDNTGSPSTRFVQSTVPYVRTDGVTVADDYADLINCGNQCLQAPIDRFESGEVPTGDRDVWTDTRTDGTIISTATDCNNWSAGGIRLGFIGRRGATTTRWTFFTIRGCGQSHRLYCFQQ